MEMVKTVRTSTENGKTIEKRFEHLEETVQSLSNSFRRLEMKLDSCLEANG